MLIYYLQENTQLKVLEKQLQVQVNSSMEAKYTYQKAKENQLTFPV